MKGINKIYPSGKLLLVTMKVDKTQAIGDRIIRMNQESPVIDKATHKDPKCNLPDLRFPSCCLSLYKVSREKTA